MIGHQLNLSSSVQKPYGYTMDRALPESSQLSIAQKKKKEKEKEKERNTKCRRE